MEKLFQDRLKKIDNLEDRKLLKDILNGVFSGLVKHTQSELKALETRIFNEIEDVESKFDIYASLVSKEMFDPIHPFLYPMNVADISEQEGFFEDIKEAVLKNEEVRFGKIFLACDYLELRQIVNLLVDRQFSGELVTTMGVHPIQIKLVVDDSYLRQIEELYSIFIENDMPWRTIFQPYIYKFMRIELDSTVTLQSKEEITAVSFDLEELEPYQHVNQVPLWNIKPFQVKNASFPVPAQDHVNYEHAIYMNFYDQMSGYLVDAQGLDISFIRREDDALTITSANERVLQWSLLQVIQPREIQDKLLGNHRVELFTDRFSRKEGQIVRSMCEISRIINAFTAMKDVVLEKVDIREASQAIEETYALNPFIKDNIRQDTTKKVMQLFFKTTELTMITRDKMSFLVSEIQLYFPEFHCVGALL
ncbi:normocyte-binding protein [Listeria booriae]|uniref:normocyte-binding protein n=1 Tax=Listeria booriae TaxID=1552123 RepID=UPI0016255D7C|nr:normocyte-binding protein [Listeria booriae]MBC2149346.1 normocyte-binding protein [Listeria booriae]